MQVGRRVPPHALNVRSPHSTARGGGQRQAAAFLVRPTLPPPAFFRWGYTARQQLYLRRRVQARRQAGGGQRQPLATLHHSCWSKCY